MTLLYSIDPFRAFRHHHLTGTVFAAFSAEEMDVILYRYQLQMLKQKVNAHKYVSLHSESYRYHRPDP